jgi:CheY-like chemotaxis protein
MPHVDGRELLRTVTADATLAGRHMFALVTANAKALSAPFRALLAEQAIPILAKPFHLEDLNAFVRQCAACAAGAEEAPPV